MALSSQRTVTVIDQSINRKVGSKTRVKGRREWGDRDRDRQRQTQSERDRQTVRQTETDTHTHTHRRWGWGWGGGGQSMREGKERE